MANAAAPAPKANMGEPAPRFDARLKVTGEARYASDFAVSNPAFAYLVTSTIAKDRIIQFDFAEARTMPGVLDILTYENATDLKHVGFGGGGGGASTSTQQLGPQIDHDGQIIAVVLADTFEAAQDAAGKSERDLRRGNAERDLRCAGADRGRRHQGLGAHQGSAGRRRYRRGARQGRRRD